MFRMQKFQQQLKEAEKGRRGGRERDELRGEKEEVPSMNEWAKLTGDEVLFCLPACLSAEEEEEVQQIMVLLNQL